MSGFQATLEGWRRTLIHPISQCGNCHPTSTSSTTMLNDLELPSGKLTWQWKITIFYGKIHYKWPFSIAMLNYQRVWWSLMIYILIIPHWPASDQPWSFPCSKSQLAPSRSLATSCHPRHASVAEGHIVKSKKRLIGCEYCSLTTLVLGYNLILFKR